jgi:hypothetical protein
MTSAPVRDPLADHLLAPQNAALLFIDYQPSQLGTVPSMITSASASDHLHGASAASKVGGS